MSHSTRRREAAAQLHPLESHLRLALGLGVALVVLLPMARGSSEWLGWVPMWLVGMPAAALWALHRFRLPSRLRAVKAGVPAAPRRRPGAQARRRVMPVLKRLPRAA